MAHGQLDQKDKAKQWHDKSLAWQTANQSVAKVDTELQGFFAEAEKLMSSSDEGTSGGKTNAETGTKKSKTPPADSDSKNKSVANGNGD